MRLDTEIRRDVEAEMAQHATCATLDLKVFVKDGIASLLGDVPHFSDRWCAEQCALRVAGVRGVANEIKVSIPSIRQRTDEDIARAVLNALHWNVALEDASIKATVASGWLRLSGSVPYLHQKLAAVDAVRFLAGIAGISNDIVVNPAAGCDRIAMKIEAAFARHAALDAKRVHIALTDTTVTLSGFVHSAYEKEIAELTTATTSGVTAVKNNIEVCP